MNRRRLYSVFILTLTFAVLVLYFGWQTNGSYSVISLRHFFHEDGEQLCTLDYINSNKDLPQDDWCIIEMIRKYFIYPPSPPNIPLKLKNPQLVDPSYGQATKIHNLLHNKTNGFFIECGGYDGEHGSPTLYMERYLGWEGLLIEANHLNFREMLSKNRKARAMPACLSLDPHPTMTQFVLMHMQGHIAENMNVTGKETAQVQCFPIYSVMVAMERTTVDLFALDVEGHELAILKTIPWDKVDIKTLNVEYINLKEGKEALISYMQSKGYIFQEESRQDPYDFRFVKANV